ncbi:uncharacterized protein LOC129612864 isoform X2 [Condylostylus longicornis]|uniref:uncharacterized protein LOC129612864 isoform X2 n=1 Tax=Condylostylus longicornis TaxID=2530218 RepID=UPI00244E128D|nr:uncharacterized protein LOC129612864 isoform X2 [Condylostylus longicornis]
MVLWFRESAGKPLYSFDVRGRPFEKALYWSDVNAFGPRAFFHTNAVPATLAVDNVQLDDEGVYRCRVDFQNSPTRNHRINLTVIVPPHQILVYDASGRDVAGAVGPLLEGDNIVLTCEVRGGRPEPAVTWFNGSQMIMSGGNGVSMGRHVTVNRLEVNHISRNALNSTYKCQASNTKLVPPAEKNIRIEMLLKPLHVNISEKPKVLISEVEYNLTCYVGGSVPETDIKWTQNNRPFKRGKIYSIQNGSIVTSILTFRPVPEDDGTILKCEGSNPRLPNSALEDSILLNVMYPPTVTLSLGSTLKADDIKEGDDVYFECHIKANPKEHRITWSHNGVPVTQNVSWGVIISTRSLVLQKITRVHAGHYACAAANDRGETQSALVNLRIRYAPVCSTNQVTIVGASLEESVPIPCRVNSDPPEIEFEWTFSSSGEHFEVPSGHYATIQEATTNNNAGGGANGGSSGIGVNNNNAFSSSSSNANNGGTSHRTIIESNETHIETYETISELIYTPKSERDYGTLACYAKNTIGRQTDPCLFQVVPAAKPAALKNCTLRPYVVTSASLNSSNQTTIHPNHMALRQHHNNPQQQQQQQNPKQHYNQQQHQQQFHKHNNKKTDSSDLSLDKPIYHGKQNQVQLEYLRDMTHQKKLEINSKSTINPENNFFQRNSKLNHPQDINNNNNNNIDHDDDSHIYDSIDSEDIIDDDENIERRKRDINLRKNLQKSKSSSEQIEGSSDSMEIILKNNLTMRIHNHHQRNDNDTKIEKFNLKDINSNSNKSINLKNISKALKRTQNLGKDAIKNRNIFQELQLQHKLQQHNLNNKEQSFKPLKRLRTKNKSNLLTNNNNELNNKIVQKNYMTHMSKRQITTSQLELSSDILVDSSSSSLSSSSSSSQLLDLSYPSPSSSILSVSSIPTSFYSSLASSSSSSLSSSSSVSGEYPRPTTNNLQKDLNGHYIIPTGSSGVSSNEDSGLISFSTLDAGSMGDSSIIVESTGISNVIISSSVASLNENNDDSDDNFDRKTSSMNNELYKTNVNNRNKKLNSLEIQYHKNVHDIQDNISDDDKLDIEKTTNDSHITKMAMLKNGNSLTKDEKQKKSNNKSSSGSLEASSSSILLSSSKSSSSPTSLSLLSSSAMSSLSKSSSSSSSISLPSVSSLLLSPSSSLSTNFMSSNNMNSRHYNDHHNIKNKFEDTIDLNDDISSDIIDNQNNIIDGIEGGNNIQNTGNINLDKNNNAGNDIEEKNVPNFAYLKYDWQSSLTSYSGSSNRGGSSSGISGPKIDYSRSGSSSYSNIPSISSSASASFYSSSYNYGSNNGISNGGNSGNHFENYDNIIYSTMELECFAGYDGGLPQHFMLEAYDAKTKKLRLNMTSTYADYPIFRIDLSDLLPMDYYPDSNPALHLVAYSVNQKGRSEPIVIENIPINEADKRAADGAIGISILPLAALLTGTLFTVGIGILLVVVIAIRKRREQNGRNMCDDKDKHLGMDVTLTAPLETGAGHQRLVVAYTLKQGIEKQPDILNAQKGSDTSLGRHNSSSPLNSRPNALFIGNKNFTTSNNYDSPPSLQYSNENEIQANCTSPSSTLQQPQQQQPQQQQQQQILLQHQQTNSLDNRNAYHNPQNMLYDALPQFGIKQPILPTIGTTSTSIQPHQQPHHHSQISSDMMIPTSMIPLRGSRHDINSSNCNINSNSSIVPTGSTTTTTAITNNRYDTLPIGNFNSNSCNNQNVNDLQQNNINLAQHKQLLHQQQQQLYNSSNNITSANSNTNGNIGNNINPGIIVDGMNIINGMNNSGSGSELSSSINDYLASSIDFSLGNNSIVGHQQQQTHLHANNITTLPRINNSSMNSITSKNISSGQTTTTIQNTTNNSTTSSRNHIITDTLPGPESCV